MSIPFYKHSLTADDSQYIAKVLDTPFLTSAGVGKEVEALIANYFGVSSALLVNSWTNGAIATLLALDLQPGDEVIVPAQTFIATANVVELLGAIPVFVDVCEDSLLIDYNAIKNAITEKTKGVIVVHLYGQMCDLDELYDYLKKRSIWLLEDAAHCFEGTRRGRRPGACSDAAIFSFYATKNITCGEGGAIITNNAALAEEIRKTRLHGMSAGASDRFSRKKYNHWDMQRLGTKANLPDILAALLPAQISRVEENLEKRRLLAARYRQFFAERGVRYQKIFENVISAEHLFPIWVPVEYRDQCIYLLNEAGIQVAVNYRSVPSTKYYSEKYGYVEDDFPVSQRWGEGTITLPLYPKLTLAEQDEVMSALDRALMTLGM